MSGKYYVAHIVQFHNRDQKAEYLKQNDAVHIPTKNVDQLLKPYATTERAIYCAICKMPHRSPHGERK